MQFLLERKPQIPGRADAARAGAGRQEGRGGIPERFDPVRPRRRGGPGRAGRSRRRAANGVRGDHQGPGVPRRRAEAAGRYRLAQPRAHHVAGEEDGRRVAGSDRAGEEVDRPGRLRSHDQTEKLGTGFRKRTGQGKEWAMPLQMHAYVLARVVAVCALALSATIRSPLRLPPTSTRGKSITLLMGTGPGGGLRHVRPHHRRASRRRHIPGAAQTSSSSTCRAPAASSPPIISTAPAPQDGSRLLLLTHALAADRAHVTQRRAVRDRQDELARRLTRSRGQMMVLWHTVPVRTLNELIAGISSSAPSTRPTSATGGRC